MIHSIYYSYEVKPVEVREFATIARRYLKLLNLKGYRSIQYREYDRFHSKRQDLEAAAWMCRRVIEMANAEIVTRKDLDKINRWLGFIQGIFAARGFRVVDDAKDDNRGKKKTLTTGEK